MTRHFSLASGAAAVAATFLWLPSPASGGQAAEHDARVVARVGRRDVLVSDLQRERAAARRRDVAARRLDSFVPSATKKLLDELIAAELMAVAAREARLEERPDVRRQIEQAVDHVLVEAMTAEVAARVDASDARLREYYESHPDEFQVPGRVRARHVIVRTQAQAVSLHGRLKRNADFAVLAREHNIDASKENGGDLGWVSRGVMVKPFEDVLFSLRVGDISPIVKTSYGFHIVKVEQIEPPRAKPFDAVIADVRQKVLASELAAFRDALAKKHPVKVNDAVLKSLR